MIALWMLYAVGTSFLLTLAATLLEKGFRRGGVPLRWVWVAALVGSVAFAALPWVTRAAPAPPLAPSRAHAGTGTIDLMRGPGPGLTRPVNAWIVAPPGLRVAHLAPLNRPLLVLWLMLSGAFVAVLVVKSVRLHRDRKDWRSTTLDGVRVQISSGLGPGVVGFLRANIVLPEWVIHLDRDRRRLVLAHETEHLRTGDTRLLGSMLVLLVVFPWNPALWWQVHRALQAVELDCDQRVLARHNDKHAYGLLLIELGRRGAGLPFTLAAFAEPVSLLERRVGLLTRPGGARCWGALLPALGAASACLVLACEAPRPLLSPSRDTVASAVGGPVVRRIGPDSSKRAEVAGAVRPSVVGSARPSRPPATRSDRHWQPPDMRLVAAELVRRVYPQTFADGLPGNRAVWFLIERGGDGIRRTWIGPNTTMIRVNAEYSGEVYDPEVLGSVWTERNRAALDQLSSEVPDARGYEGVATIVRLAGGVSFSVHLVYYPGTRFMGGSLARSVVDALLRSPIELEPSVGEGRTAEAFATRTGLLTPKP